ncbi:MAG: hypothetical protein QOG50_3483, partial [Actinomycetota bacterium]|nr:hypothetical protein [Actinomycetota bacterium]
GQHEQDQERDARQDVTGEVPPVRTEVECNLFAVVEQAVRVRHAQMLERALGGGYPSEQRAWPRGPAA